MPKWASAFGRGSIGAVLLIGACEVASPAQVISGKVVDAGPEKTLDPVAYFRMPENDALNCLYLQLRTLGYREDYETFRGRAAAESRSFSLLSLASLAGKLGYHLVPVKMTVAELVEATAPTIVHVEERGVGRGRFDLFLGIDETETRMLVIHGSYLTREWMSRDDFRRVWTQYALVVSPPIARGRWVLRSAAALVLVGGVVAWLRARIGHLGW